MRTINVAISIEPIGKGHIFQASVNEIPGCVTEAGDLETVLLNLCDSMALWLETNAETNPPPQKKNIFEADPEEEGKIEKFLTMNKESEE